MKFNRIHKAKTGKKTWDIVQDVKSGQIYLRVITPISDIEAGQIMVNSKKNDIKKLHRQMVNEWHKEEFERRIL